MPSTRILIFYTGGTIGMGYEIPGDSHSPLIPQGWEFLQKAMPALSPEGFFTKEKEIEFTYKSFEHVIDSSEFNPNHWAKILNTISENYNSFDGFIIIHGTDTMAYTASALSFALQNLGKPVVLTGSQLPIFHPRTDGIGNLSNAIHIAAAKVFNLPIIPEVLICFNDKLLRGNRSTKSSSKDFSGFESPSFPVLGSLEQSIKISEEYILEIPKVPFSIKPDFETNIIIITLFPGFNPDVLNRLANDEQLKGIILRTFGSGNAPSSESFINALQLLVDKGKTVLNISQCQEGFVNMKTYKTGNNLYKCGVISGADMTLEAATAKMMWLLGNKDLKEIGLLIGGNLRGELSGN
ncbi:MAG: asparaginase [Bacteroidia bacterium]